MAESNLINGRAIANKILVKTAELVQSLKEKNIVPSLAVILVGDDQPSRTYVRKKKEMAEKAGINFQLMELPVETSVEQMISVINNLQQNKKLTGLIIQLPLPDHLYTSEVLNTIDPAIDVDCFTDVNIGKLVMKTNFLLPPTPDAVMSVLRDLEVNLAGKNVTIIGAGTLVGKPLAIIMLNERASVTVCNSLTKDLKEKCLAADVIVSGVGKKNLVRGDMVRPGTIVIDAGFSNDAEGKVWGDVNVKEVQATGALVTPTPGGIGPITVANLLWNTARCAERKLFID